MREDRLHYLDNTRAFIMSIGIVLHAGVLYKSTLTELISTFSGLFRMKLFVFISGYFAYILIQRWGHKKFRIDRLLRFGVPCVIFTIFANPIANLFLYREMVQPLSWIDFFSNPLLIGIDRPKMINWHDHLWFLYIVLFYSLHAGIFIRISELTAVKVFVRWILSPKVNSSQRMIIIALTMTFLTFFGRSLHYLIFQDYMKDGPFNFLVQASLWYWPYYFIGILAAKYSNIMQSLQGLFLWQIATSIAIYAISMAIIAYISISHSPQLTETIKHISSGLLGHYILCAFLFIFFRYFNDKNKILSFLADASYTVYLSHFLFLYLIAYYLSALGIYGYSRYISSICLTYILCLLIHRYLVIRSGITLFLLNGKK